MVIEIQAEKVLKQQIADYFRLKEYVYLISNLQETDVSKDYKYRTTYDGFYGVRKDETWRDTYFEYFEAVKNSNPTFEEIINYLKEKCGTTEPSFSSKMLATIKTDMPIWDSRVLNSLGLKKKWEKNPDTNNAVETYEEIQDWYNEYLESENADECMKVFDAYLPDYKNINKVKKIDYLLWGEGGGGQ